MISFDLSHRAAFARVAVVRVNGPGAIAPVLTFLRVRP